MSIVVVVVMLAVAACSFAAGYGLRSYVSMVRKRRAYWQGKS
jgi:Tfp pilus assembly protein PilP